MLMYILLALPIIYIIKNALSSDVEPIFGVHAQPGKWFGIKYCVFWLIFQLRKYQNKKAAASSVQGAGYGRRSRATPQEMDKVQELPKEHPMAVDAVYFNGGSREGQYLVMATARRHHNLVQTLLFFRVPGVGLFELPSKPDTSHYTEDGGYSIKDGLKIEPTEAMKRWKLSYDGKLRLTKLDKTTSEHEVKFCLDWSAYTPLFDFDVDMSVPAMCTSIAREKWTRQFFTKLKTAHQTHYEQFGEITGSVCVSGMDDIPVKVQGVRDHSYGNIRDWRDLHRYSISYLHCEDGMAAAIGVICMPLTMSRIVMGYVVQPGGICEVASWTDFELYKIGEDGTPPKSLTFSFIAGGKKYDVKYEVVEAPTFYMGYEWEARIIENFVKGTINGKACWGISEWDYRNKTHPREKEYKDADSYGESIKDKFLPVH
ncbi:unnamed protein product [Owenia fusiformis]|uniref:Uncharacterized protein n=1 Tax=Owenia fusiformis TaxID=6347 RepID=A0A8J1XJU3_OWEFU|nr:unnamed protein product [Owenia fusiformis]